MKVSYRDIWRIAAPIMIASAAQNVIALMDSFFLFNLSETDFATIGFVSVFYLIVTSLGYGFSRGGQIIMARRKGEADLKGVGRTFFANLYLLAGLSVVLFLLLYFFTPSIFKLLINQPIIYEKAVDYMSYRAFGVLPAFIGMALLALYTGLAKTRFVIINTVFMLLTNLILNYGLIFGHLGLPKMGIAGAALASTLAEVVAMVIFALHIIFDRRFRKYGLGHFQKYYHRIGKGILEISIPLVAQAVAGMGSWFAFFTLVENMGERPLAIANLGRLAYLILSIPAWGFAVAVNSLVSQAMGATGLKSVLAIVRKVAIMCFTLTIIMAIPILIWPKVFLQPIMMASDTTLFDQARPILWLLFPILGTFSITSIYYQGLVGTGDNWHVLKFQCMTIAIYVALIYCIIVVWKMSLEIAWSAEIFYWVFLGILIITYFRKIHFRALKEE